MDFGTIKVDLRQMLGRDPLALAFTAANDELSKRLRIFAMEITADISATDGNAALPADCEEIQEVYVDSPRSYLTPTTAELAAARGGSGAPCQYIVGNNEIRLTPAPEDGFALKLVYYQALAALTDDTDTNAALQKAPTAFIYSVLAHHSKLIRNHEAANEFAIEAEKAVAAANWSAQRARYSGGTIEPGSAGITVT